MLSDLLLKRGFARSVLSGALDVTTAAGRRFRVGDGRRPEVAIRFADTGAQYALLLNPELRFGELYVDGRLLVEKGTLFDLLTLLLSSTHGEPPLLSVRVRQWIRTALRPFARRNHPRRARRNVAHHYDQDGRLYDLFLDADRQYSCAYFERDGQGLDEAQLAKKRHIAAKLLAGPGHTVLDIGCGWGGLALYLAEVAGCDEVLGVTLSREQLEIARRRAAPCPAGDRVRFALADYRSLEGQFDRIVSVGMFEHVGLREYLRFFTVCRDRLKEGGVMLLHSIGRTGSPAETNAWVRRYIFPGGHLPTLSEIMPRIERSGLVITDLEVLRLHYADTLRHWRERFLARGAEAERLYGTRFCRTWELYLAMSEAAFRFEDLVVFQIQLTRRNDVVPTTRGYIAEAESRLRRRETRLDESPWTDAAITASGAAGSVVAAAGRR